MTHGTVFNLVSLQSTVCYFKYTMDEFDLGSSSATKLVSEYGQEIPQSVADPGPLMPGVLDRWTPTVNV